MEEEIIMIHQLHQLEIQVITEEEEQTEPNEEQEHNM
jgi:hypothetical protein